MGCRCRDNVKPLEVISERVRISRELIRKLLVENRVLKPSDV